MPSLKKYTKEWLEELCADSYSLAEVLKKQDELKVEEVKPPYEKR